MKFYVNKIPFWVTSKVVIFGHYSLLKSTAKLDLQKRKEHLHEDRAFNN